VAELGITVPKNEPQLVIAVPCGCWLDIDVKGTYKDQKMSCVHGREFIVRRNEVIMIRYTVEELNPLKEGEDET
jgi:hypothetical protein